jgi:hypothetical protein
VGDDAPPHPETVIIADIIIIAIHIFFISICLLFFSPIGGSIGYLRQNYKNKCNFTTQKPDNSKKFLNFALAKKEGIKKIQMVFNGKTVEHSILQNDSFLTKK